MHAGWLLILPVIAAIGLGGWWALREEPEPPHPETSETPTVVNGSPVVFEGPVEFRSSARFETPVVFRARRRPAPIPKAKSWPNLDLLRTRNPVQGSSNPAALGVAR